MIARGFALRVDGLPLFSVRRPVTMSAFIDIEVPGEDRAVTDTVQCRDILSFICISSARAATPRR